MHCIGGGIPPPLAGWGTWYLSVNSAGNGLDLSSTKSAADRFYIMQEAVYFSIQVKVGGALRTLKRDTSTGAWSIMSIRLSLMGPSNVKECLFLYPRIIRVQCFGKCGFRVVNPRTILVPFAAFAYHSRTIRVPSAYHPLQPPSHARTGVKYLVPSTCYQVVSSKYLLPGT